MRAKVIAVAAGLKGLLTGWALSENHKLFATIAMHTFFVSSKQIQNTVGQIQGEDAHHLLRVLRARLGELVKITDDQGRLFEAKIIELGENVRVQIVRELIAP